MAGMIKDAHDLAEWVATYDELLDKRQLHAQSIQELNRAFQDCGITRGGCHRGTPGVASSA